MDNTQANSPTQQPVSPTPPPVQSPAPVQAAPEGATSYVAPSNSGKNSKMLLIVFVILLITVIGIGFYMLYKPQTNYQTSQPAAQQNPVKSQTEVPTAIPQPTTASDDELNVDTNLDSDLEDLDTTLNEL